MPSAASPGFKPNLISQASGIPSWSVSFGASADFGAADNVGAGEGAGETAAGECATNEGAGAALNAGAVVAEICGRRRAPAFDGTTVRAVTVRTVGGVPVRLRANGRKETDHRNQVLADIGYLTGEGPNSRD